MMFRKYFLVNLAAIALLVLFAVAACAQMAPLRGHVKLKQADGSIVPAANAVIDVFRTDLSGKYNTKADKKGDFVFAGLPFVGAYIIAASLPNAAPAVLPNVNVKQGIEYELLLRPGDGSRLSESEAKSRAAGGKGAGANAPTSGGRESAADKAKREEVEKKNAEIEAKNKHNTEINEVVGRTFKAGNDALLAKNYDEAIKQYQEGIAADPEQAALYTQLSTAFRLRGVDRYNGAIKSQGDEASKSAAFELAKQDFRQSAENANKAVQLIQKEVAAPDASTQAAQNNRKLAALSTRAESMRLLVTKVDQTQVDAGMTAYQEYLAVETVAERKAKGEHDAAQMLFDANAFDKALVAYQNILATNPDDLDALLRSGQALFNIGAMSNDKTKYQEAANYLKQFADKAPDTNPLKADARAILETLKDQENVKPEKTTAPAPRKRKP